MGADGGALGLLPLACPIDGRALAPRGRTLVCENGHAYDLSRHGYVNLLPVQFKPSRDPGDDAAMVAARRRVFDDALFEPLSDAVTERVRDLLGHASPPSSDAATVPLVVDAGCGEGSHTAWMAHRLRADDDRAGVRVFGTDISVHAIKAAARRHRDIGWAVANNTRLPLLGGTVDVVVSLFGFETWKPWAAMQRSGQHVVVAHAGPRHLIELREAIYADVRVHDPPSAREAIDAGYALVDEDRVAFDTAPLAAGRLADVLAMTPHGHRAARDATEAATRSASSPDAVGTSLSVEVILRTFRRT